MTDDTHRPGEIAIDLPDHYDAGLYFIGRIRTPWADRKACPKNSGEAETMCTLEVDPRYAAGLRDVETASHLIVLYFMHEAARDLMVQAPGHYAQPHGTFALRSPVRPNPIAISMVQLVKVEGLSVQVIGLDCVDGTPLLDIKPYFTSTDSIPNAVVGWRRSEKQG